MAGEGLAEVASSLKPIPLNRVRTCNFFSNFRMTRWVAPLFLVEINFPSKSAGPTDALSHRNLTWASAAVMRNSGSSPHISSISGVNHSNP